MPTGLLTSFNKFQIQAFKDVSCTQSVFPKIKPMLAFNFSKLMYKFPFNPSTLKVKTAHTFNLTQPTGFTGINPKFVNIKPKLLYVELVIDPAAEPVYMFSLSAGLPAAETLLSLSERIEIFEDIVGYESSTHRPHYLLIEWGDSLNMKATVKEYQIIYGRFNDKGEPTRATIQTQFLEVISAKAMLAEQSRQSPDVSHQIEIKEGDTIMSLCEEIYGDSKYYIEVARINGLKSIRNLKLGSLLYFPPLK